MTIQIEIGTKEQYEKIVRLLTRLKVQFTKQENTLEKPYFDMAAYRQQIKQISVWTDADIQTIEQSTQNFNWTGPEW